MGAPELNNTYNTASRGQDLLTTAQRNPMLETYGVGADSVGTTTLPNGQAIAYGASMDEVMMRPTSLTATYWSASANRFVTAGLRHDDTTQTYEFSVDGIRPDGTSIRDNSQTRGTPQTLFNEALGVMRNATAPNSPIVKDYNEMLATSRTGTGQQVSQVAKQLGGELGSGYFETMQYSLDIAAGTKPPVELREVTPRASVGTAAPGGM